MPTNIPDFRAADVVAVRATVDLIAKIAATDLALPTPCAGWDLATLLKHMTEQHDTFAAAVGGASAAVGSSAPDPVRDYFAAAERVLDAFSPAEVLDREVVLAEAPHPIPGRMAISFHLVDYVVHGWDVARSLGLTWELPDDVLRGALAIAEAVPDDAATRKSPGAPFAPRLPEPPTADPLSRILTLLGRSPTWSPPN
ncbi:TIGR03086 family metal-binding protein [Actinoplanes sp. NPDC051861]|uniref:TIGR03086 family metal-binding protein n=1 Tax=Actinoplanes sp. NPDC051861 TaxID=3155170 RepID=UPI003436E3DE